MKCQSRARWSLEVDLEADCGAVRIIATVSGVGDVIAFWAAPKLTVEVASIMRKRSRRRTYWQGISLRSSKPSVRFITRKWPPAVGGMETYSARLAELLPEHCALEVIALPGRADGRAPSGLSLALFGLRTFFGGLVRSPADVTHIGDLAAWPLALAGKMRNRRSVVVVSAHGTDVSFALRGGLVNRGYRAYLGAFRWLMPSARVIANSTATAEALETVGLGAHAIVPLAADQLSAGAVEAPGDHILFAGRLARRKGLSWFVENVLDTLPSGITLKVAGPAWDASEEKALEHPRVEYLGALTKDQLGEAYRAALCVIVPNLDMSMQHFEGFGLVAPEAASSGGVVLGARIGGLPDAIRDGETGFLLAAGQAGEWHDKIVEVAGWSEEARRAFIHQSQETCRVHFSWERVARDTFDQYGV